MRLPVRLQVFVLSASVLVVLLVRLVALHEACGQSIQSDPGFPGDLASGDINRLIRQLGSNRFLERKAADEALAAIGRPALDSLRRASAQNKDLEIQRRAQRLVDCIENRLDSLLDDYRSYGLPLPPAGAKLVRFNCAWNCTYNGEPMYRYVLGFLLPPANGQTDRIVLFGTSKEILEPDLRIILVRPEQARAVDAVDLQGFSFHSESALLTALECESLGWHNLAQVLLHYSVEQDRKHDVPKTALARLAWEDWDRKLWHWETDWKKASECMHTLIKEPFLNTREHQQLLCSLDKGLVPSKAMSGSIEAMIDDLIAAPDLFELLDRRPDSKYIRIFRQGMAGVPTLLDHLDDDRLTRRQSQRPTKWRFHHDRVRDVVSDLLRDLADGELGKQSWMSQIKPERLEKEAAQAWWDKARHLSEEPYLLAHALPTESSNKWPNQAILRVLAEKYPRQLLKVYRTLLDERPEIHSWPLAELVAKSSLPEKEKLAMLRYAERHSNSEHKLAAQLAIEMLTQKR